MSSAMDWDWDLDDVVFCGNSYYRLFIEKPRQRSGQEPKHMVKVMLLGSQRCGRSFVMEALKGVSQTTDCLLLFQNFPKFFRGKGKESDLRLAMIDTLPPSPNLEILRNLRMEEIHVIVLVVRSDQPPDTAALVQRAESLFGPEWHCHALVIFTRTDQLKKSGLRPSDYLSNMPDSLRTLARQVGGGYLFFDLVKAKPLREQLLRLSARNHHKALKIICSKESSHSDN